MPKIIAQHWMIVNVKKNVIMQCFFMHRKELLESSREKTEIVEQKVPLIKSR